MGHRRIHEREAFAALTGRRDRARSQFVSVRWRPGEAESAIRVAYSVSRRVGGAVVRNRIRRRLRAAMVEVAPPPGDYLVTASSAAADVAWAQLVADLARAVSSATAHAEVRP
ncbi:MAG: ribonuclease P protein component [Acidimicrobiales bacterium]